MAKLLDSATRDGKAGDAAAMVKAVTDGDQTVLAPTILRLAALAAGPSRITPASAVIEALDRHLAAAGTPRSVAAFARDLLDRAVRDQPKTRTKWAAEFAVWSTSALSDLAPLLAGPLVAFLTSAELKALAATWSGYPIVISTAPQPRRGKAAPAAENSQPRVVTRTSARFPPA